MILVEGQILLSIWLFLNLFFLSHASWSQLLKIKMRNEIMLNAIYGCHHWREAAESKKLKRLKVAFFKFIQIAQQST